MTVLVIGAAGTIGRACAVRLATEHDVIAADVKATEISGTTSRVLDVTNPAVVKAALQDIDNSHAISGLIYAAGLNTTGYLDSVDWTDYERVMAVNLRGAFHVGSALLEIIRKKPRTIATVFISSTAGLAGEAGGSIYCASKFGLIGFTQSFAGEISQFGGRANIVCPGNVDSPMLSDLATKIGARQGMTGEQLLEQWKKSSSLQRLIKPEEVAESCAWLISAQSSGVNGQIVIVDGTRV